MKNFIRIHGKISVLLLAAMLYAVTAFPLTFTAVSSGNWSSSATWSGGIVPTTTILTDQIVIPSGIIVTMDNDVSVSGALSSISVQGTLSSASSTSLTVGSLATVSGTGTLNIGNLMLNTGGVLTFAGTLTAQTITNAAASLQLAANTTVAETITLSSGAFSIISGGALAIGSNGTIVISGGLISLSGGSVNLTGTYNVSYTSSSSIAGLELSGSGLNNISVNVGTGNTVTLSSDLTSSGVLSLSSGSLVLNGHNLTINGSVTGLGSLSGSGSSNLTINTSGGLSSALSFAAGGQSLNNFTINVGSGNSIPLGSMLTVDGTLSLTNGSQLSLGGSTLTLNGDISGTGSLITTSSSGIVVSSSGGLTSNLNFASGSGATVGNLTVNTGAGGSVTWGNSLTVSGTLSLQTGSLVLSGNNLTIGGAISGGGSGTISSTSASNITINSSSSLAGALSFTTGSNTVNNLTVNVGGTGGSVSIGSDLNVSGTLGFTQGSLNIGGNGLFIGGSGSVTGAGSTSYVITGTNGHLNLQLTAGAGSATTFNVGTSTNYAPVALQLNSGSASGGVNVGVASGVYAQGTTGTDLSLSQQVVNTTYFVEPDNVSNTNLNLQAMWSAAMAVNGFDNTSAYISHYTGGSWDASTPGTATLNGSLYSVTRANISSFSPFAVFDQNTQTGVEPIIADNTLQIYPNPAVSQLTIETYGGSGKSTIEISEINGQIVGHYEVTGPTNSIGISDLNAGTYFIKVSNSEATTVKKFNKI